MPIEHFPSQSPAWAKCACYVSGPSGEAAERGTLQHAFLEALLKQKPDVTAEAAPLDITEQDQVAWAAGYIMESAAALGLPIESEIKLEYGEDFEPIFTGTADAIIGTHLFDYKSGQERDYTYQMMAYAAMMYQRGAVGEITVHILYGKTKTATRYEFTREQSEQIVQGILARVLNSDKQPTPCDYCGWCAAAATCPALAEKALAVSQGRPDWALESFHSSEITNPVEMSKALALARLLAPWCEAVEHHAKEMATKNGEVIPGWGVGKRAGHRTIKDTLGAWKVLEKQLNFAEIASCATLQVGKVETALGGKKQFDQTIGSLATKGADIYFLTREKEEKSENAKP